MVSGSGNHLRGAKRACAPRRDCTLRAAASALRIMLARGGTRCRAHLRSLSAIRLRGIARESIFLFAK